MQTPRSRLAHVARRLRLPAGDAVFVPTEGNDVWRIADLVLRVCWRGDPDRFRREAAVAAALPPEVPYPPVVAAGRDDRLAWQLTRAISGCPLDTVWPSLTSGERRAAVHRLGEILTALHAHPFPAEVLAVLGTERPTDGSRRSLIGASLNPLPRARALDLAAHLNDLDPDLAAAVRAALSAVADPLAEPATRVVHGDAHFGNVLWHDGAVVALLDLEWARPGPADLELQTFLRPGRTDAERRTVLRWLAETGPGMFAAPDLAERLWLYDLAFTTRWALIDEAPQALRALRRLLDGPGWQRGLLPDGTRPAA